MCAVLIALVVALVPGPAAFPAYAAESLVEGDLCFLDTNGQQICPSKQSWPQPPLLGQMVYDAATPAQAQALRDTEDQALANVLAGHQLPQSDLSQVKSYARADAQSQMWALIVEALRTPDGQRTATQQALVDWMSDQVTQQRYEPAANAATEYARFAGKDVIAAYQVFRNGSEQQIKDFLSGPAEPYSDSPVDAMDPREGGYCKYHPPAPYTSEYDGSTVQWCYTPCQSAFGCAPPTPTFDQFVRWGQSRGVLDSPSFALQSANIALGSVFGSVAVGAGILAATAIPSVTLAVATSAVLAAIVPFSWTGTVATPAAIAAIAFEGVIPTLVTSAAVTAAVGAVTIVLAAIAIAAVMGIQVANIDQLPGKLAAYVVQSRAHVDAATMVDTQDGASVLYALFVAATLPLPLPPNHPLCDTSGIVPTAYNYSKMQDGWIVWWPLGEGQQAFEPPPAGELRGFYVGGCLNAVPVREAAFDDPRFVVTDNDTGATTDSASITVGDPDTDFYMVARVSGNWFVAHPVGGTTEVQTLALPYTDWDGTDRIAWLARGPDGYKFFGILGSQNPPSFDRDTCLADHTCFEISELHYLGPDGHKRSARLEPYVPAPATTEPSPTGAPSYAPGTVVTASAVTFSSGGFAPAGAVGPMSYEWRFQKAGCGMPCVSFKGDTFPAVATPDYTDPVTGPSASYTWQTSGRYQVELTATDSEGRKAVTTLEVPVRGVAPTLTLARDCSTVTVKVACNDSAASVGDEVVLFGGVKLAGTLDNVRVWVDWGDGTNASYQAAGADILSVWGSSLTITRQDDNTFQLRATHSYSEPGFHRVTIHAVNQVGQTDTTEVLQVISGPQTITFGQPEAHPYGETFRAEATGGPSGRPVTYTAGPAEVCTAGGDDTGSDISMVGVGSCTVTAHQAGAGPIFLAAEPVSRSFEVLPAHLNIKAEDKTKTYGAANPELTAQFTGLTNGDTADDVSGLVLTAPAANQVGQYDIVASGASNPNYTISYEKGRLEVTRAPLTITPDDQTRVYGGPQPAYTATFDGLVNGDTPADISDVRLTGPPPAAHAGQYDITAGFATSPNYEIHYAIGTETITPAPLTVTAKDLTRKYGSPATYTASYDGLVNGDTGIAGLEFAGAPDRSDVGDYPIVLSGGDNPDYDITLVDGTETVTPASLTIQADDKTRVYGAPSPDYTTSFSGLKYDDSRGDFPDLLVTGASANAGVGSYPIRPDGATNPNYQITYVAGTETVTKAPLTITAHHKSKVYGAPDPVFTAAYDGLVNGDTPAVISGLDFTAAPTGSDVGTYPIVPTNATSPNYEIEFADGTETITPAPLTIIAEDARAKYGTIAGYTWRGAGWVNGDADATITTAPTCTATIRGAAASVSTAPGSYPGAITCSGAADPNYAIGYTAGRLTVNPVIRLDQTGLPATVPQLASLDGRPVALPTGEREVGYGTDHHYRFPKVVVDPDGVTYLTRTHAFTGAVVDNRIVTARYRTMSAVLAAAVADGGLDQQTADRLTRAWNKVQAALEEDQSIQAWFALHRFAHKIRALRGTRIEPAIADTLMAYTRLVYGYVARHP